MNEKEKEAILELKHFINMTLYWQQEEYTSSEIYLYIKDVLNLIEKQENKIANQEKEIKLMKSVNINDNYVSKDTIREKIKELVTRNVEVLGADRYEYAVRVLQELLED